MKIYELVINPEESNDAEVSYIALVDAPAIKKDFIAFNEQFVEPGEKETEDEFISRCIRYVVNEGKDQEQAAAICYSKWENRFEKKPMAFAIQNEDERIITGPLMIPNQLIYRNNERFGEHYVKFSSETIRQIAIKFAKKGYQKNVNLMHDADMQVNGATMFESFISDSSRGVKPMEQFSDLPDGTWFGSFYVENPEVWKLVKEGNVRGFSVEGMFDYEMPESTEEKYSRLIVNELAEIFKHF
jgi:hypothetical protein